MENETTGESLRRDLDAFGVAFLMMTPDGKMKRLPPEAVKIDMDALKSSAHSTSDGKL